MNSPLHALVGMIEHRLVEGDDPKKILEDLAAHEGAKYAGYCGGTYRLNLAKVRSTCTSCERGLLHNWCKAARRKLAKETVKEPGQ